MPKASRTHCIRCGECCLKGSPSLHTKDLELIGKGGIERGTLYTIRKGELVRDNIQRKMVIIDREMIKLKEQQRESGGCALYNEKDKECRIYEKRPIQCSTLKCWDTDEFFEVYHGPKLTRREVIDDRVLLGLMTEHEEKCSYLALRKHVNEIKTIGEDAVEKTLEMLKFDYHLRPFVSEKLGVPLDEMDFIFGRPLISTVDMFGLKVIQESDGVFCLTAK
jgi:Fe-S-cluster containining protein